MAKQASKSTTKAPWKKTNPRKKAGKASTHLSPAKKKAAKAAAKRAGRPYPNLVDNMRAAKKKTAKRKTAKKATRGKTTSKAARKTSKTSARKTAKKARRKTAGEQGASEKDPRGGPSAAGRKAFAGTQGAHLKPAFRSGRRT